MLQSLAAFIKTFLVPGSFSFLVLGLTLGILLLHGPRRSRRFAVILLTGLGVLYWLESLPVVASALATRFHAADAHQRSADDISGARAIVVLGAGARTFGPAALRVTEPFDQTIFNAFEGARLSHLVSGRLPVIASGGVVDAEEGGQDTEAALLRDLLIRGGVPAERILLESASRTTHEQVLNIAPMIKRQGWDPFVVVAPAVQMPRAVAGFLAEGVHPMAAAAPFKKEDDSSPGSRWIPNAGALGVSERAAYDYLAWGYYWMRGWLRR
jgi:uncharacterized SAM-binding protein YcdF (DUF218 family)